MYLFRRFYNPCDLFFVARLWRLVGGADIPARGLFLNDLAGDVLNLLVRGGVSGAATSFGTPHDSLTFLPHSLNLLVYPRPYLHQILRGSEDSRSRSQKA